MIAAARAFAMKLSQTTPRERAGLAALAAIGALTAVVYAVGWAGASAQAAATAAQAAADGAVLQANFQDEAYRQQLAAGANRVWRWSRASDTLVGDEIATELEALCLQAGFIEPRITLLEQAPSSGRVGALEASVSAVFDWASLLALLEAFEAADLSFTVRSIDVADEDGGQHLTLVVAVPIISADAVQ
jgi:hypothetical protein